MIRFLILTLALSLTGCASRLQLESKPDPSIPSKDYSPLTWIDAKDIRIDGKGWDEPGFEFMRLPQKAQPLVTEGVWNLADDTAGLTIHFQTNSPEIHAHWSGGGAMNHMAATGVSGLDLYKRNEQGDWEFVSIGRPKQSPTTVKLVSGASPDVMTEYLLFLPLYHHVDYLKIGLSEDADFLQVDHDDQKPIVFYGTSIVQGGCSSRTGMSHTGMIRRWFDRDVINLGFSGNGNMPPVMVDMLAEIDAAVYILDCFPNMTNEMVDERFEPFVRDLREKKPETPIILVEHLKASWVPERIKVLNDLYKTLREEGWDDLYIITSEAMLRGEEEATVDGIHPTDLGFYRMAVAHREVLEKVLPPLEKN